MRPADQTHTLFGQVRWYAAVTAGLFTLGAYRGRNLAYRLAFVCYLLAFACLIGMRFAFRRSAGLSGALLFGLGLLMGLNEHPCGGYAALTSRVGQRTHRQCCLNSCRPAESGAVVKVLQAGSHSMNSR